MNTIAASKGLRSQDHTGMGDHLCLFANVPKFSPKFASLTQVIILVNKINFESSVGSQSITILKAQKNFSAIPECSENNQSFHYK